MPRDVLVTNDAVVFGILALLLGLVFYTYQSKNRLCVSFYKVVPALLMCYFLPSLLNTFDIVDGESSKIYHVASRYLLPACLVMFTLSLDLKAIMGLGPKAVIMFLTGTVGIVIGGPIAILVMSVINPEALGGQGPDAVWRGMTTVAGSWIGGGANQLSMKEIYEVGGDIFSAMVTVDVVVANIWMAVLLFMASKAKSIDTKRGADTSAIDTLKEKIEQYEATHLRIPQTHELIFLLAITFGVTGFAHVVADVVTPYFVENFPGLKKFSLHSKFFWMVITATSIGIALSFTRVRKMEAIGTSRIGQVFIYILVASIGLQMDVRKIMDAPQFFALGVIWMLIHASLMLIVARFIKAPVFYMAVGSQANVGGAASAPVVASAFHPSLAPVGILLAVFGYALGTYMAWICGQLMMAVSP